MQDVYIKDQRSFISGRECCINGNEVSAIVGSGLAGIRLLSPLQEKERYDCILLNDKTPAQQGFCHLLWETISVILF